MKRDQPSRSRPPRILWGRVAFYGLSLLIVFALGSWSAGDDAADAQLEEARAEIERLSQENTNLRAERDALEAGDALEAEEATAGDGDESEDADAGGDTSDEAEPEEPDAAADEPDLSEPPGDDAAAADGDEADDATAAADPASSTYVVREGDTGRAIAEAVYGDQDLWPLIVEANDLGGDNVLQVDQELVIPPSD